MTTRTTKAGTIVQVREPQDLITETYSTYSETDLLIEKAELSQIIRENLKANLSIYQRRLNAVETRLSALALQAA